MNQPAAITLLVAACLALAGCGDSGDDAAAAAALDWTGLDAGANWGGAAPATGSAAAQPGATAVAGGDAPPHVGEIVVENGVRYRAGPNDARVRVDGNGAEITVDTPDPDMPMDAEP
jgi:hypothetical protein